MTTCIYDRRTRTVGADSQNTAKDGSIYRSSKIVELATGWFMGSGHCFTISQIEEWAKHSFNEDMRPDFSTFLSDTDEYGFSCIFVAKGTYNVYIIDDEMTPVKVLDEYVAVGSGAAYALGAMDAGMAVSKALEIAAARDPSTSAPFEVRTI